MDRRAAKRRACHTAWRLLEGHNNEFLHEQETAADLARMEAAWRELMDELFRRGEGKKEES